MCGVCGIKLQQYTAYMAHMNGHNTAKPPGTITPIRSGERNKEKARTKEKAKDTKLFRCHECNKTYMRKDSLLKHMRFSHPPLRPLTHMKLRGVDHKWLDSDAGVGSQQPACRVGRETAGPQSSPSQLLEPVEDQESEVRLEGERESQRQLQPRAGERVAVLPVCGEIQVERREEEKEEEEEKERWTNTILKKHGSWNVFYFRDNPVT